MAWTERYCSVAGGGAHDGTSEADAWTLAEAIAGAAAGQRVNVKAGTYTNTTTDRTFATAGTTTAPVWWRGYKTAIGDMDGTASHGTFMSGTEVPAISFTTGRFIISGVYQKFSNLDIQGAQVTNGQVNNTAGTRAWMDRCRVECTAANANGRAINLTATQGVLSRCWFKATSSADCVRIGGGDDTMLGCAVEGGANGIVVDSGSANVIAFTVCNNTGGDAIRSTSTSNRLWLLAITIYSPTSDGVEFTGVPTIGIIANSILSECGGYGVNQSSGTNTANIARLFDLFHSNTSGNEVGFGDWPSDSEKSDGSSPFTNAGSGDLSLVSSSNGKASGMPGAFENQSYTSYLDIGAVQRQESGGSAGMLFIPNLDGV